MSIPRRIQVEKLTPAERAIFDAMSEVEKLPPDERLTRAIVLLAEAKDRVGDFVDGIEWKPSEDRTPEDYEAYPEPIV